MLQNHINDGKDPKDLILDQRLTSLRPKNNEWTIKAIQAISKQNVMSAWRQAGLGFLYDFPDKHALAVFGEMNFGSGKLWL